MKIPQISCIALSALFTAALLAGCASSAPASAGPGESPAASAAGDAAGSGSTAGTAASPLDDGMLRIFTARSDAVFCGAKLLGEYPANAQTYLLQNSDSNEQTGYFVVGMPEGSDAFHYWVYDSTGAVVYDCGTDKSVISYTNGWLRLGINQNLDIESDTYGSFASQIDYNLKTGEERPLDLESGASQSSFSVGGMTCTVDEIWSDSFRSTTTLTDAGGNVVKTFEHTTTYQDSSLPENWIMLYDNTVDSASSLYNVKTEALYEHVAGTCSGHYAYLSADDGASVYNLIDLDTGETVLNCDDMPYYYFGGNTLSHNPDSNSDADWYIFRHADGTTEPVSSYAVDNFNERGDYSDSFISTIYLMSGSTISAYGIDGSLLWTQTLPAGSADANTQNILSALSDGRVFVEHIISTESADGGLDSSSSFYILDQTGTIWQSSDYTYLDVICGRYLIGYQNEPLRLYSVLSSDGTPLVTGLGTVSIDTTGDATVLNARKGFSEGWMDLSGNWLWSRSIWQSASDEGSTYIYG